LSIIKTVITAVSRIAMKTATTVNHVPEEAAPWLGDVVLLDGIGEVCVVVTPTVVKLPVTQALVRLIALERTRQ
jgi:hypothetical protein